MAAIRRQWKLFAEIKTGTSKFTWRHTSNLENYGDAVTEMVDDILDKFDYDHGFGFKITHNTVLYG
jgi:hypothetical protein